MSTSKAEPGHDPIPLLEDIAIPAKNQTTPYACTEGTETMNQTNSHANTEGTETINQSTSKNPFLPHENLAKLALERAEFQETYKVFFEQQKNQKPASSVFKDTQDLDRIVHLATQKVLTEYIPQIEQRVRAEVIRQLGPRTSSSDRENT